MCEKNIVLWTGTICWVTNYHPCHVILKRSYYDKKFKSIIDEGINNGTYAPTTDSTLSDLKKFQDFLHRNFKDKISHYKDMRPVSNQPGRLYTTAKTLKFNLLDEITAENLKFEPIISQVGTYTYNAEGLNSQLFETFMPKRIKNSQYKIIPIHVERTNTSQFR